jgi:acetolactate synthase-1/2/3 large subunit
VREHDALDEVLAATLAGPGPSLCDVVMPADSVIAPKVAAERLPDGHIVSKPLEDMTPLLGRDELADNMLVPPWQGQ